MIQIRSVSFDTSFLLNEKYSIDKVIKLLVRDSIPSFITSIVVSELEQLKVWGRITKIEYNRALRRWKQTHATIIDFKNRLFSNAFSKTCIQSMEEHHGVKPVNIANDCNILVSVLKNGVDIFLSEDYHFTSEITKEVIDEVTNIACSEFHQMCETVMYSIDTKTFLEAYTNGDIDIDIVKSKIKNIKKNKKLLNIKKSKNSF